MIQRMRLVLAVVGVALIGAWVGRAGGDEAPADAATSQPAAVADRADLEKQFAAMLSGAALEGTWQMARGDDLEGRGPLSEAHSDKYSIASAVKLGGERWLITARIQYADRDVSIPVPVRVVWADDVPMITLDTVSLPLLGEYSARVIFHRGYYSGVWHGANYGGVMSGRVVRDVKNDAETKRDE